MLSGHPPETFPDSAIDPKARLGKHRRNRISRQNEPKTQSGPFTWRNKNPNHPSRNPPRIPAFFCPIQGFQKESDNENPAPCMSSIAFMKALFRSLKSILGSIYKGWKRVSKTINPSIKNTPKQFFTLKPHLQIERIENKKREKNNKNRQNNKRNNTVYESGIRQKPAARTVLLQHFQISRNSRFQAFQDIISARPMHIQERASALISWFAQVWVTKKAKDKVKIEEFTMKTAAILSYLKA